MRVNHCVDIARLQSLVGNVLRQDNASMFSNHGFAANGRGPPSRHNVHTSRVAELPERLFAVFPCQAEGAHVRDAEAHNHGPERVHLALVKLAFHERVFSPIHQLLQGDSVMEIGGHLVGHGLLGNQHGGNLHFLVAYVHVAVDDQVQLLVNDPASDRLSGH
jgi:hypothetical protein